MPMPEGAQIALGIGATTAVVLGLRYIFGKVAMSQAIENAEPGLSTYRTEQAALYTQLPPAHKKSLDDLHGLILVTNKMQTEALKESAALDIPKPRKPESPQDIALKIKGLRLKFKKFVNGHAIKHTKHHIQHLVHHEARGRVMGLTPGISLMGDSDTPEFDENAMTLLDKTGLMDMATFGEDMIYSTIPDSMHDMVDDAVDAALTPGVMSATKSAFREAGYLLDGNMRFQEAFEMAIVPGMAKTVAGVGGWKVGAIAGAKIDVMSGGLTAGLGTLAGGLVGWLLPRFGIKALQNDMIQTDIRSELHSMEPHLKAVDMRKREAQATIHEKTSAQTNQFQRAMANCPALTDTPQGKILYRDFRDAIYLDADAAVKASNQKGNGYISALPKRNLVDFALGIDRHGQVSSLYQKAADDFAHDTEATALALADGNSFSTSVKTIQTTPQLKGGQVGAFAANLPRTVPKLAEHYAVYLGDWQATCAEACQKSVTVFAETTLAEQAAVEAVEKERNREMAPSRQLIRRHLGRLGKDPDRCP